MSITDESLLRRALYDWPTVSAVHSLIHGVSVAEACRLDDQHEPVVPSCEATSRICEDYRRRFEQIFNPAERQTKENVVNGDNSASGNPGATLGKAFISDNGRAEIVRANLGDVSKANTPQAQATGTGCGAGTDRHVELRKKIIGISYDGHGAGLVACKLTLSNGVHVTGLYASSMFATPDLRYAEQKAYANAFDKLIELDVYAQAERKHAEESTRLAASIEFERRMTRAVKKAHDAAEVAIANELQATTEFGGEGPCDANLGRTVNRIAPISGSLSVAFRPDAHPLGWQHHARIDVK